MNRARFNRAVFFLEGLNSLGTSYYFNYLFFYLTTQFHFSNLQNLQVCALNGFVYMFAAYYGGKFGQRRGYLTAFALGCVVMIAGLTLSAVMRTPTGILACMVLWTLGMCFTWPNLEALVTDRMAHSDLPQVVGQYNVVWAGCSAVTYFAGGSLAKVLGWQSIFWLPIFVHAAQLGVALWLQPRWRHIAAAPVPKGDGLHEAHPQGALFLKLAWIANPFAYIAINAIIPLIPDLAARFHLTAAAAGVFCSLWFFARMFTFVLLAFWPGWHYRFSYLFASYIGMLFCFAGILLFTNIWLIVAAQIVFGWCLGVIYYSSLYYSMHVGDAKGEHGGFHEAAIGAGIFGGPAVGALSLMIAPEFQASSVIGVALVLAIGFGAMCFVRKSGLSARIAGAT